MNTYTAFAVATMERAVKTFAQTLAALLVVDGTGLLNTAWTDRVSVAGMAALLSVLTSVASAPFGGSGPSLATEKTDDGAAELWIIAACAVVIALVLVFGRP